MLPVSLWHNSVVCQQWGSWLGLTEIALCYQMEEKELALALPVATNWAMTQGEKEIDSKSKRLTQALKTHKAYREKEEWENFIDKTSKASISLDKGE